MLDSDLIDMIATKLEAASAAAGWNYVVIQVNGPTQQGIPSEPMIMFQKLFDVPYGWPADKNVYDEINDRFINKSLQEYRTTFQVSALVIQVPDNSTLPTASDVVNYMYQTVASRFTASEWMKLGANIERIATIGNSYFTDDRNQFEARPSFDIVVTHSREVEFHIPAAHEVVGDIHADFTGQGTFPVP